MKKEANSYMSMDHVFTNVMSAVYIGHLTRPSLATNGPRYDSPESVAVSVTAMYTTGSSSEP